MLIPHPVDYHPIYRATICALRQIGAEVSYRTPYDATAITGEVVPVSIHLTPEGVRAYCEGRPETVLDSLRAVKAWACDVELTPSIES